jgi:hypothetical protein
LTLVLLLLLLLLVLQGAAVRCSFDKLVCAAAT